MSVPAPPLWPELSGKRLGILGFGHIGRALARRPAAFEMRVCAIRRETEAEPPEGVAFVGGPERLDELLRGADCLAAVRLQSPRQKPETGLGRYQGLSGRLWTAPPYGPTVPKLPKKEMGHE